MNIFNWLFFEGWNDMYDTFILYTGILNDPFKLLETKHLILACQQLKQLSKYIFGTKVM